MLKSTRSNLIVEPSQAILKGLADDGGLYVFDQFNKDFFSKELIPLNYQELAKKVFREFLTDYSAKQIDNVVTNSYNKMKFKGDIVDIVSFDNYSFLNLFNGNTFAFKDLALSCLPNLMAVAKEINSITKDTIILTATSGDTGSATLEGFKDMKDVSVIVLYPLNGVSEFQELQMNKYRSDKNFILPVEGNFDDCQKIVKDIFLTVKPTHVTLSSANSINIGRIIPQTVYYFYAYLELVRSGKLSFGEAFNVTVPTGNFGNVYSAFIAKNMGLPIKKLIVASNENKVLSEVFNEGKYSINRSLHKTISPSMDIIVSSNFERYLFDVYKHDSAKVKQAMESLQNDKYLDLNELISKEEIEAYFSNEEQTKKTIKEVFEKENYLIDPHTAVAYNVAKQYIDDKQDNTYMLVVSTANPYKFSDAVIDALDLECKGTLESKFKRLEKLTNYSIDKRMKPILKSTLQKESFSIDATYKQIKKIVGAQDA